MTNIITLNKDLTAQELNNIAGVAARMNTLTTKGKFGATYADGWTIVAKLNDGTLVTFGWVDAPKGPRGGRIKVQDFKGTAFGLTNQNGYSLRFYAAKGWVEKGVVWTPFSSGLVALCMHDLLLAA